MLQILHAVSLHCRDIHLRTNFSMLSDDGWTLCSTALLTGALCLHCAVLAKIEVQIVWSRASTGAKMGHGHGVQNGHSTVPADCRVRNNFMPFSEPGVPTYLPINAAYVTVAAWAAIALL